MASSPRAGIELLDLATRGPLYLVSASEPLVILLLVVGQPRVRSGPAGLLLVLSVLHTVACLLLLRAGLARVKGERRPPAALFGLAAGLTVAGLLTAALVEGTIGGELRLGLPAGAAALTFCVGFTGALAPTLAAPGLVAVVAVGTGAAALGQVLLTDSGRPVWAVNFALVVGTAAFSYRFSVWFLGLAWELSRSREVQAQLAVAEERLRFARDLHDVLGRNLALIAVNSQLAAELARRGQDGAIERMLDVHRIAQDSMREVREVVAGSRTTDLETELTGARSVLRSAGIAVRVIGDGTSLPTAAQAALGWVVREATTNIIRHSDPSLVRIEVSRGPDGNGGELAVLRIENDAVLSAGPTGTEQVGLTGTGRTGLTGTGLNGLRERLSALGGELSAEAEPAGRYVVEARLPLTGMVPPMKGSAG